MEQCVGQADSDVSDGVQSERKPNQLKGQVPKSIFGPQSKRRKDVKIKKRVFND